LTCPLPSAFINQTFACASGVALPVREKAILAPFGDQTGSRSGSGLFDRSVCPLPSGFMTKISSLPVTALS
jgi:hypothetical protein